MTDIVEIFHNILWSKYKGVVFSALHRMTGGAGVSVRFVQIAQTELDRVGLAGVDMSYHDYPHDLLFKGSYSSIPKLKLTMTLVRRVLASPARLVVLPGYDRIEYWAMLFACVLARKRRAVFCDSTLYDHKQSWFKGLFKRIFFGLCDGYFAYGSRSGELLRHFGARPQRIFQRCQAAALDKGYSVGKAREQRARLAGRLKFPNFIYVGRLSAEKSLDVLIRAFAVARQALPGARLSLIGSGPQLGELKTLSVSLGLGDSVAFAGSKVGEDLAQAYSSATCLVLPSRSEPWGLVVNEALHYGCPVIVSDHCGCVPELVLDGVTGYVFATGSIQDLAEKMTKLPQQFVDVEEVADRCLQTVGQFIPNRAAAQILDGCKTILANRV